MGVQPRPGRSQRKSKPRPWDGDIQKLEHLGHGVSGMVLAIDEGLVAKIDTGSSRSIEDIAREREVYRRLEEGNRHCRYVLRCYEIDNPSGLVLERCSDTVRSCLKSRYRNSPPPEEVVKKWASEAAQGLAYIHRKRIVQGDGTNQIRAILSLYTDVNKLDVTTCYFPQTTF
jgi:serine/threonine protein kinase